MEPWDSRRILTSGMGTEIEAAVRWDEFSSYVVLHNNQRQYERQRQRCQRSPTGHGVQGLLG